MEEVREYAHLRNGSAPVSSAATMQRTRVDGQLQGEGGEGGQADRRRVDAEHQDARGAVGVERMGLKGGRGEDVGRMQRGLLARREAGDW